MAVSGSLGQFRGDEDSSCMYLPLPDHYAQPTFLFPDPPPPHTLPSPSSCLPPPHYTPAMHSTLHLLLLYQSIYYLPIVASLHFIFPSLSSPHLHFYSTPSVFFPSIHLNLLRKCKFHLAFHTLSPFSLPPSATKILTSCPSYFLPTNIPLPAKLHLALHTPPFPSQPKQSVPPTPRPLPFRSHSLREQHAALSTAFVPRGKQLNSGIIPLRMTN